MEIITFLAYVYKLVAQTLTSTLTTGSWLSFGRKEFQALPARLD